MLERLAHQGTASNSGWMLVFGWKVVESGFSEKQVPKQAGKCHDKKFGTYLIKMCVSGDIIIGLISKCAQQHSHSACPRCSLKPEGGLNSDKWFFVPLGASESHPCTPEAQFGIGCPPEVGLGDFLNRLCRWLMCGTGSQIGVS